MAILVMAQSIGISGYPGDAEASGFVNVDGELEFDIADGGSEDWHVQATQVGIPLNYGEFYRFEFDAHADADRLIVARLTTGWSALV